MEFVFSLVFSILLSIAVGAIASKYGRNFFGWSLSALVISLIMGFIVVLNAGQSAEAHYYRGIAKVVVSDLKGAISDYSRAIYLNPGHAAYHNNRGKAKGELGDWEEAISDYSIAIGLDPDYAEAYYKRGHAKEQLGDREGAEEDLQIAERLS